MKKTFILGILTIVLMTSLVSAVWYQYPLTSSWQYNNSVLGGEGMQQVWDIDWNPSNASRLYVSTDTMKVWRSDDGGMTWIYPGNNSFYSKGASSVVSDPNNADFVIATGDAMATTFLSNLSITGFYVSYNAGNNWVLKKNNLRFSRVKHGKQILYENNTLNASGTTKIYAGATTGLYLSLDQGNTWNLVNNTGGGEVYDLEWADALHNTIYISTNMSTYIFNTTTNSTTTTGYGLPGIAYDLTVQGNNYTVVYASSTNGLYRSLNSTRNFTSYGSGYSAAIGYNHVTISPANISIMYLSPNGLGGDKPYRSINGGATWTELTNSSDEQYLYEGYFYGERVAPHPTNQNIAITQRDAAISKTIDAGQTWTYNSELFTGARVNDMKFVNSTTWLACLIDYGLYITTDAGQTWRNTGLTGETSDKSCGSVDALPNGTIVASIGSWTSQDIWTSPNWGVSWTQRLNSTLFYDYIRFAPHNNKTIYAGFNLSLDGGTTWNGTSWEIRRIDPRNSSWVYAFRDYGSTVQVVKSNNNMSTITQVCANISSGSNQYDIAVDPNRTNDFIWVAAQFNIKYCNASLGVTTAWATTANGSVATDNDQEAHFIEFDMRTPGRAITGRKGFSAMHGTGFIETINYGVDWYNINANLGNYSDAFEVFFNPFSTNTLINSYGLFSNEPITHPDAPSQAQLLSSGTAWLFFNWSVNNGSYYDRTTILIDGVQVANKTATQTTYNATGLVYGTNYLITLRNYDTYGNWNESNTTLATSNLVWTNTTAYLANITNTALPTYAYSQGIRDGHVLGEGGAGGIQTVGQSFTIPGTGIATINNITVILDSYDTITDTVRLSLYNVTGDTPVYSQNPIVWREINNTPTSFGVPTNFTFSFTNNTNSTNLTKGNKYAFVITNAQTFNYRAYANNNTYSGGTAGWEEAGGISWNILTEDLLMEITYESSSEPGIRLETPTPTNNSALLTGTTYTIYSNSTTLGSWAVSNISIYNASGTIKATTQLNSTLTNLSFNINETGLYYFNATAYDDEGFSLSETRQITIYSASLALQSPINATTVNNTLNVTWQLNSTQTSLNITQLNISIDNVLITTITGNTTLNYNWTDIYNWNLSTGLHTLSLNATTTEGQHITANTLINVTRNAQINISAAAITGGGAINTFSGWVYNLEAGTNQTYTSTTGLSSLNETRGNLTIYIESDQYALNNTIMGVNLTNSSQNAIFLLYDTNTINITFHNEATPTLILTGPNITLDLISPTISYTYFTTNGTIYASLLQPETYTLRYSSPGYTERYYTITVTNKSANLLDLYLLNNSNQINLTVSVIDELASPYPGVNVKSLKYDLATNTYILQETRTVNTNGQTTFTVTFNDEFYKFIVEESGSVLKMTEPAYITSNSLTIQIDSQESFGEAATDYASLISDLQFNTASNNFRLDYNDASGITENILLVTYLNANSSLTLFNTSNSSSASGSLLIGVYPVNGTTYTTYAYYKQDGIYKYLTGLTYRFPDAADYVWGRMGLFIQILITLGISALAFISPVAAMILSPLTLVLGSWLGIIPFNTVTIAGYLVVVGVILAIIMSKKTG